MRACVIFVATLMLCVPAANADMLVAARTIPSKTIITSDDVIMVSNDTASALQTPADIIGLEARVVLYEGRPIRLSDVGPAALVERNQIVTTLYRNGTLTIEAEGRALGRAASGEPVRVMNIASRKIIMGTVAPDGTILVGPHQAGANQ